MTVNNAMTEMMQALEQGDLALIDQLLESFFNEGATRGNLCTS